MNTTLLLDFIVFYFIYAIAGVLTVFIYYVTLMEFT